MRSITLSVIAVLFVVPLAAQQLHQATPIEELMHRYHALAGATSALRDRAPDGFDAATARTFNVTARTFSFGFSPAPFVVNQGDSVTLRITSTDVQHGFFLEHYDENSRTLNRNQTVTIQFIANTPGSFSYFCTVFCGSGHTTMGGTLVVNAAPAAPAISSFTPMSGPASGGTVVAINGSNFQNGATVKFGSTAGVGVTFNSSTSISTMSPAQAAGDVTITVTNPDGQSATLGTFTYTAAGPAITSVTPSGGSVAGGTVVTINGSGFTAAGPVAVTFGGVAGTNVVAISATSLTVVAPPHDAGAVDVVVTVGAARATAAGGFSYFGKRRRAVQH